MNEMSFFVKREHEESIKKLLEKCNINNFWVAEMSESHLLFTIKANYEKLDRFNEERKLARQESRGD